MRIAARRARPSWLKASACCAVTPPSVARALSGSVVPSTASWIAIEAEPMSSIAGVMLTVALRMPRMVVIVAGPNDSSTEASSLSGCGPSAVGSSKSRSSSTVVGAFSLGR